MRQLGIYNIKSKAISLLGVRRDYDILPNYILGFPDLVKETMNDPRHDDRPLPPWDRQDVSLRVGYVVLTFYSECQGDE